MIAIYIESIAGHERSIVMIDNDDPRAALYIAADRILNIYRSNADGASDPGDVYGTREEDWVGYPYPALMITKAVSEGPGTIGATYDVDLLRVCDYWPEVSDAVVVKSIDDPTLQEIIKAAAKARGYWPLTPTQAERAYDKAPVVPLSDERITEIVDYATGKISEPAKPVRAVDAGLRYLYPAKIDSAAFGGTMVYSLAGHYQPYDGTGPLTYGFNRVGQRLITRPIAPLNGYVEVLVYQLPDNGIVAVEPPQEHGLDHTGLIYIHLMHLRVVPRDQRNDRDRYGN